MEKEKHPYLHYFDTFKAWKYLIIGTFKGRNSVFETFNIIMGFDLNKIKAKKVTNLPSPSGSSNTALLNVNNEVFLGLHPNFFKYIQTKNIQHLEFFKKRWENKKMNKSKERLPSALKGFVNDFKVWSYKWELPEPII